MENFVAGVLISNEPNAVYEGSVFDRYLKLQLDNGGSLVVFDPEAISGKLVVGHRYQIIIFPLVLTYLQYIEKEENLAFKEGLIHGKIKSLNWMPPQISSNIYRAVHKGSLFGENPFILVETSYGAIILKAEVVERRTKKNLKDLKIDGFLQWEESRFDLVAALDPLI